jgi:uncharacterized membrane protein
MLASHSINLARVILTGILVLLLGNKLEADIAAAIRFLRSGFRRPVPAVNRVTSASELLRALQKRYARGEITRAQYDKLRRRLLG